MGLLTIVKNNIEGFKEGFKYGYTTGEFKEATCDIKEVEKKTDVDDLKDEKYSVELTATGPNKVKVIKIIREIMNLGLKEAKDIVENTPNVIIEVTDKTTANNVKTMIEAEGAEVTLNNLVFEPKETSAVEVGVCPICKNRIDEDTKVCPYCGHMFI